MRHAIAAVFAHPDDETFAVAGTVARYARQGVPSVLFCATDGDAGKSSSVVVSSPEALGAVRRAELDAATRMIGFTEVVTAGHRDGKLADLDADVLIGEIVDFLRAHRPTVVITFGPEGAPNAHRDHRAISRATTAAFFLAGNPTVPGGRGLPPHQPARLYYTSWAPPAPDATRQVRSVPATCAVDVRELAALKERAFGAHVSQHMHRAAFETALAQGEEYALAAGVAQPSAVTDDLFAGLEAVDRAGGEDGRRA